jgi:hypothetical protein
MAIHGGVEMAAKKAAKQAGGPTKADFIRANAGLTPKEVEAKAKEQGLKVTAQYVSVLRSQEKKAGTEKATPGGKRAGKAPRGIAVGGNVDLASLLTDPVQVAKARAAIAEEISRLRIALARQETALEMLGGPNGRNKTAK